MQGCFSDFAPNMSDQPKLVWFEGFKICPEKQRQKSCAHLLEVLSMNINYSTYQCKVSDCQIQCKHVQVTILYISIPPSQQKMVILVVCPTFLPPHNGIFHHFPPAFWVPPFVKSTNFCCESWGFRPAPQTRHSYRTTEQI